MSDKQLIDEVVGYLTKDGAVMDLARARQGAKLIRRQHARIEADEALMRNSLEALNSYMHAVRFAQDKGALMAAIRIADEQGAEAITALRKRLESSNAS